MENLFPYRSFILSIPLQGFLFFFIGVIFGVGLGAASTSFMSIFCLLLCFQLLRTINEKFRYCLMVFIFYFGSLLTSYYWIVNSVSSIFESEILTFLTGGGLLLVFSLIFSFLFILLLYPLLFLSNNRFFWPLLFSCCWVLSEYVRSFLPFSYPFSYVGYLVFDYSYLMQAAFYISIYGVGAFVLFFIVLFSMGRWAASIIFLVVWGGWGGYVLYQNYPVKGYFYARIINANVMQKQLEDFAFYKKILDKHKDLSIERSVGRNNSLVVWPESILRFGVEDHVVEYASDFLGDDQQLISGGFSPHGNKGSVYNSLFLIDSINGIEMKYDKRLPLLAGEYFPYRYALPYFLERYIGSSDIVLGDKIKNIVVNDGIKIYPLLCSEAHYTQLMTSELKNSDFILILANEAWVHGSSEIFNLLKASTFRAVESRKTVVLVSNGGYLALIDPFGDLVSFKYELEPSFLDVDIAIY